MNDVENGKKKLVTITRKDFISKPYKNCPECKRINTFGVFTPISGSNSYSRECIKCGFNQNFKLPKLSKKVLYLDQFVISNLIKLLDKSHPSHKKIKKDLFWQRLFIALEKASKSQVIICPDSFYHAHESSVGGINFLLAKRLYEHFSGGKTLYPSSTVERFQIQQHFSDYLDGNKSQFIFDPQDISFGQDLHVWEIGLMVSVGGSPRLAEVENIKKINASTLQQLADVWKRWQSENINFEERAREEVLGFGKGIMQVSKNFFDRRSIAMQKIATDPTYEIDLDDILPPPSNELLESMTRIARAKGVNEYNLPSIIGKYLTDADILLEIPSLKISSVMFAGLARRAKLGEKKPPKSTTDVQFIASYLPYSDAMFVDKQSATLLNELPSNTPKYLRINEHNTKIFSLCNREDFLNYLEEIVSQLPEEQLNTLKDLGGDTYAEPYWSIIEHEKKRNRIKF